MNRVCVALLAVVPLLAACERPSVLVLALDGADWDVMDPLMEAGFLPAMRDVVEQGVRGEFDCAPALPALACFCPPVWASLATGHVSREHGIRQVAQPPSARRVKAVWSVLRDYGGTSTAVGMRTTWPPDPDFDYVLTMPGLTFAASEVFRPWPAGLSLASLLAPLRTHPPDLFERLDLLPHAGERPEVYRPIARDRVAMEALRRLLAIARTDLTVVLLHSPDKVEHLLWGTVQPELNEPVDAAAVLGQADAYVAPTTGPAPFSWGSVVAPYLEIDAWLGDLLEDFPFDYVILVSDHGMTRNSGRGLPGVHGPMEPDAHRGILAIRGHQVRKGREIGTVDVTDFAPTLAYLLGLPVGDDLPGRVLEEVFVPGRLRSRPIVRVPSWERPAPLEGLLELRRLYGDPAPGGADDVSGGDD